MSGSVIVISAVMLAAPLHSEGEEMRASHEIIITPADQTRAAIVMALRGKLGKNLTDLGRAELAEAVVEAANTQHVDPFLVLSVISVESEFKHTALSKRHAQGLMQMKNATAFEWSDKTGIPMAELGLFDETTNVVLGSAYLKSCHDKLGSWSMALAAYNWGPAKVRKAVKENHGKLPERMRDYEFRVAKRYRQFTTMAGFDAKARAASALRIRESI